MAMEESETERELRIRDFIVHIHSGQEKSMLIEGIAARAPYFALHIFRWIRNFRGETRERERKSKTHIDHKSQRNHTTARTP